MKLNEYGNPRATRSAKAGITDGLRGIQETYASHPAAYGENCPVCGCWEDEKIGMWCPGTPPAEV